MLTRTLLVVAAGLLIAADTKDDTIPKVKETLKGTWQVVSIFHPDGIAEPEHLLKNLKLTFIGYKVTSRDGRNKVEESSYKINSRKMPKEIDIITEKTLGIYELDDDILKICIAETGSERPKEFKTDKKARAYIITLKRDKK